MSYLLECNANDTCVLRMTHIFEFPGNTTLGRRKVEQGDRLSRCAVEEVKRRSSEVSIFSKFQETHHCIHEVV